MEQYLPFFWLAVIIVAAVAEAATSQLVSIWFVLGGISALIANLFGAPLWLQWVLFAGVSMLTLLITRPLVKKLLACKRVDTNADRYIGETGIVTMKINNTLGLGQVNVRGSVWTARSADDSEIPEGCPVRVKSIEGVKLIVERVSAKSKE
ncbi:MAG: NfeD family protein [Clostridiales bacterium]|jgi:membrane protein implicated in regulation of membrane protease activity|nr:NfeD family protein [Clostridiales bacterium]